MRAINISNTTLTFPDQQAWLYDNTYLVVENSMGDTVGAEIQVTNIASGEYRKLKHISELSRIVFPLNDTLFSLYGDSWDYNVVVKVYVNNNLLFTHGFDFQLYEGRSLPLRAHGSTRTIYVYDSSDLAKIQMLFPTTGNVNVNGSTVSILNNGINSMKLDNIITVSGEYRACYNAGGKSEGTKISITSVKDETPFSAVAELFYDEGKGEVPEKDENKGDIWADSKFKSQSYCFRIIYDIPCADFNYLKVRYIDTDGCVRFLAGRILEDTTTGAGNNYYRLDTNTVYKNISRKYITESSGVVKVGYANLRRDSYWNDILLSPKVEFLNFDNKWLECSVVDDSATVTDEESEDVVLSFKLFVD